jgi:hypothetical protein
MYRRDLPKEGATAVTITPGLSPGPFGGKQGCKMFGSSILDVAMGLIFSFLMISLVTFGLHRAWLRGILHGDPRSRLAAMLTWCSTSWS